jgi:hypothetical protein
VKKKTEALISDRNNPEPDGHTQLTVKHEEEMVYVVSSTKRKIESGKLSLRLRRGRAGESADIVVKDKNLSSQDYRAYNPDDGIYQRAARR